MIVLDHRLSPLVYGLGFKQYSHGSKYPTAIILSRLYRKLYWLGSVLFKKVRSYFHLNVIIFLGIAIKKV